MRGKGLGNKLMLALMDAARVKGLKVMEGEVLNNNAGMLKLMHRLGYSVESNHADDSIKKVCKVL
jgi:acetyltransferase